MLRCCIAVTRICVSCSRCLEMNRDLWGTDDVDTLTHKLTAVVVGSANNIGGWFIHEKVSRCRR